MIRSSASADGVSPAWNATFATMPPTPKIVAAVSARR